MAFEYQYGMYNPGQYPGEVKAQLDEMVADGWQVHTAIPNYTEMYVLWHRELPVPSVNVPAGSIPQKQPELAPEGISGGLRSHEGQVAR